MTGFAIYSRKIYISREIINIANQSSMTLNCNKTKSLIDTIAFSMVTDGKMA